MATPSATATISASTSGTSTLPSGAGAWSGRGRGCWTRRPSFVRWGTVQSWRVPTNRVHINCWQQYNTNQWPFEYLAVLYHVYQYDIVNNMTNKLIKFWSCMVCTYDQFDYLSGVSVSLINMNYTYLFSEAIWAGYKRRVLHSHEEAGWRQLAQGADIGFYTHIKCNIV